MISFTYLISILKNAIQIHQKFIFFPKDSLCLNFLKILYFQGFISRVCETKSGNFLKIYLKYTSNGTCVIKNLRLLSTVGKKNYYNYNVLAKLEQGTGVFIISTNHGLYTNQECLKKKIGGTVLCFIA